MRHCAELCGCAGPHSAAKCLVTCKEQCFIKGCSSIFCSFLDFLHNSLYKKGQSGVFLAKMEKNLLNASSFFFSPLVKIVNESKIYILTLTHRLIHWGFEYSREKSKGMEKRISPVNFSYRWWWVSIIGAKISTDSFLDKETDVDLMSHICDWCYPKDFPMLDNFEVFSEHVYFFNEFRLPFCFRDVTLASFFFILLNFCKQTCKQSSGAVARRLMAGWCW